MKKLKGEGWIFVRKRYLLVTTFLDWYKKQSDTVKMGLPGLVLGFIYFVFPYFHDSNMEEIQAKDSEPINTYFSEKPLSFYNPYKPSWNGKDKEAYAHLRKPENLRMLHETFKKIGYGNLISEFDRYLNPCMIWSYINKPCNELADSLILTYELDTIESEYYREFWERRKVERNASIVYIILSEISSQLYQKEKVNFKNSLVNDTLYQLLKITHLNDSIYPSLAMKRFNYLKQIGLHGSAHNLLFEQSRYIDFLYKKDDLNRQLKQDSTNCHPWPWVEDDTK